MTNHDQLPTGLIIPPMPTEMPETLAQIESGSDIYTIPPMPDTLPSRAIVSTEAISSTELPLSIEPVQAEIHAISETIAANARSRANEAEVTAGKAMAESARSHADIEEKVGQQKGASEVLLAKDIDQIDITVANLVAYYQRQAEQLKQEARTRHEMRIDAVQLVNDGNEAAFRGALRSESNISTTASRIRIILDEQGTILDRAKTRINEWSAELSDTKKNLSDEQGKVARYEETRAKLNDAHAKLIEEGDDLHVREAVEHNQLYMEAQDSDAFKEALNAIYNRSDLTEEQQKEEHARLLGRTWNDRGSAELALLVNHIKLNKDAQTSSQNGITHYTNLIDIHLAKIQELTARINELPQLIIAEKELYSNTAEKIKQLDSASKVLARTAVKYDVVRRHPEMSTEELLKIQPDEEIVTGKGVDQQILAALRPLMLGGSALVAALKDERETAVRLATKTINFDVESSPQLTDPTGKPIATPDSTALSGRDRRQDFSKETRRSLREKLMATMGRWVLRSNPKGNGFDFEVVGTTQQSLTMGHED